MEDFFLFEIKQRNCSVVSEFEDDQSKMFEEIDEEKIIVYDQFISLMSTMEQAVVDSILVNKEFWT